MRRRQRAGGLLTTKNTKDTKSYSSYFVCFVFFVVRLWLDLHHCLGGADGLMVEVHPNPETALAMARNR